MKKIAKYILNQVAANQLSPEEAKDMLLELENQATNPRSVSAHEVMGPINVLKDVPKKENASTKTKSDYSPNDLNFFYEHKDLSQPFALEQEGIKALKVQPHHEITSYLCHAMPLCAILTETKLLPWFYEHYIDLFVVRDAQGFIKLDFLEYRAAYKEVLYEVYLGYDLLPGESEIINFIREKIDLGFYVLIHLDEYYLPVKKLYQKEHFTHNSMIFGYDDGTQKFRAMGFNTGELFTEISFDYGAVSEAYKEGEKYYRRSAPWAEHNAVELLKLKEFKTEYPFDIGRFVEKLDSYLSARGDSSVIFSYNWALIKVAYGLDVYGVIIHCLEQLLEGRFTIDYRAIHLLFEHKKGLYQRLRYILEKFQLRGILEERVQEYSQIVDQVGVIRRKFLELNFSGGALGEIDLANIIGGSIGALRSIKESEQKILQAILDQLRGELVN